MYVPRHFEEKNVGTLHGLIRSHPLGAWVTQSGGELLANHIPFLLDPARGEFGTLIGHVARANSVWQTFSSGVDSLVIFQGPEAYITPSWYPGKQAHGKVVPTWNCAVVHAHGSPRIIEDKDWLLAHVTQLSAAFEEAEALPWKVADAPADFIENLTAAIVGVEIPIVRLVGKWKASQNRAEADQKSVVAGLWKRGVAPSRAMAELMDGKSRPE